PVEKLGENPLARECASGQRGDELLRALGHDHASRRPALAQPPDQIQALVGCNAAADDEKYSSAVHVDPPCCLTSPASYHNRPPVSHPGSTTRKDRSAAPIGAATRHPGRRCRAESRYRATSGCCRTRPAARA